MQSLKRNSECFLRNNIFATLVLCERPQILRTFENSVFRKTFETAQVFINGVTVERIDWTIFSPSSKGSNDSNKAGTYFLRWNKWVHNGRLGTYKPQLRRGALSWIKTNDPRSSVAIVELLFHLRLAQYSGGPGKVDNTNVSVFLPILYLRWPEHPTVATESLQLTRSRCSNDCCCFKFQNAPSVRVRSFVLPASIILFIQVHLYWWIGSVAVWKRRFPGKKVTIASGKIIFP